MPEKWLTPRPESDLGWLLCSEFARLRGAYILAGRVVIYKGISVGIDTGIFPQVNPSEKCWQDRLTRGTVTCTMRRAAHPSGCARCGAGAVFFGNKIPISLCSGAGLRALAG